ncbi:uncharacterized protein LOC116611527 [Nematostella vectensis]|uniref:uncharacterized protein LOC116611527 n=1 Tax=Nematostella vectensis TaxID=45351 RepID=UPI002076D595|nr:uncharacterized protein LOC116611527 [Nematostella vectensis]
MNFARRSCVYDYESSPSDLESFLEFTDRMNIPLAPDYINQISHRHGKGTFDLDAFEIAVKDSKVKHPVDENLEDRRLQNVLWRAWWRQKRFRTNATKRILREDEMFDKLDGGVEFTLRGKEIGDIPTEYSVTDLKSHELPVVGTYVDPNVSPGFRYKVRVGGSDDYLFEGKAVLLERVGAGYGKRLTFESEDVLHNDNFFWSDSNPDAGFAFSIQIVSQGETFRVFDGSSRYIGEAEVTTILDNQQILGSKMEESGLNKTVTVEFDCKLKYSCDISLAPKTMRVSGVAEAHKSRDTHRASVVQITDIELPDFGKCVLRK